MKWIKKNNDNYSYNRTIYYRINKNAKPQPYNSVVNNTINIDNLEKTDNSNQQKLSKKKTYNINKRY